MKAFLCGKDVFAPLLAGFGKSLVSHSNELQPAGRTVAPRTRKAQAAAQLAVKDLIGLLCIQSASLLFLMCAPITNAFYGPDGYMKLFQQI